ncbi:dormancy-associated protein 2-like [Olea europaea var. sylvestris]|uniref:dormancy-associated protein 2-like n=1 Tax=Olea europaea var. sylvestris TaxID=158386 RepID=UPI000C1D0AE8|nr:dormancy-associated protein 2-like [Olea europaea var. sylvestris]
MSPPLRRSRPATPEVQMPESSVDRDREGRPVSPPAPSPRASTIDLFDLLMEMRGDMAELRENVVTLRAEFGDMAHLRYDVAMLRAGLGDLYAEVAAIRGDIASLRGTSDYRDGGGSGGTGHYRDGGGDGATGGYRDGGTGGYRDGGGDGGGEGVRWGMLTHRGHQLLHLIHF